ncbi:MAG: winged helix-turn-helix domain-containing protein [Alphaproteobacteria bacterium]|nr:winged helix-turn-helix domain-containing protein [Alphaproteobacteria bacterium]
MSNVLILSENTVFKEDLSDQIKYHIPEFEIVEDSMIADIIVIDENEGLLKKEERNNNAPMILLTKEEDNVESKVQKIILKPFVLSRFFDALKSSINIFENSDEGNIEFNQYILYPSRKEIFNQRDETTTKLTEREVSMIKYLYKNADRTVSKNDLMQEVWEYSADVATHTVETHIYRLRQKIEQDNSDNQIIITSEGGYQLKL